MKKVPHISIRWEKCKLKPKISREQKHRKWLMYFHGWPEWRGGGTRFPLLFETTKIKGHRGDQISERNKSDDKTRWFLRDKWTVRWAEWLPQLTIWRVPRAPSREETPFQKAPWLEETAEGLESLRLSEFVNWEKEAKLTRNEGLDSGSQKCNLGEQRFQNNQKSVLRIQGKQGVFMRRKEEGIIGFT